MFPYVYTPYSVLITMFPYVYTPYLIQIIMSPYVYTPYLVLITMFPYFYTPYAYLDLFINTIVRVLRVPIFFGGGHMIHVAIRTHDGPPKTCNPLRLHTIFDSD